MSSGANLDLNLKTIKNNQSSIQNLPLTRIHASQQKKSANSHEIEIQHAANVGRGWWEFISWMIFPSREERKARGGAMQEAIPEAMQEAMQEAMHEEAVHRAKEEAAEKAKWEKLKQSFDSMIRRFDKLKKETVQKDSKKENVQTDSSRSPDDSSLSVSVSISCPDPGPTMQNTPSTARQRS
jgi:hypothetical protein